MGVCKPERREASAMPLKNTESGLIVSVPQKSRDDKYGAEKKLEPRDFCAAENRDIADY